MLQAVQVDEGDTKKNLLANDLFTKGTRNSSMDDVVEEEPENWVHVAPPDNQREFEFPEDGLSFSSKFDSGNLIQVERTGPFRYCMYTAPDCANSPNQTNNRQWFHFAIRGGTRGCIITFTFIGMMHCKMFTYGWTPVMSVCPGKPHYNRIPGRAIVVPLEIMPPTPGYPGFVLKPWPKKTGDGDGEGYGGDEDAEAKGCSEGGMPEINELTLASVTAGNKKKKKEQHVAMNLTFDVRIDVEIPLKSQYPLGHPQCPAIYIASNHPYSYTTLQQHIKGWSHHASVASPRIGSAGTQSTDTKPAPASTDIYFSHEILCKTLDGLNVDLLTITDNVGICEERVPLFSDGEAPYSSAKGETSRPHSFPGKLAVVLTARVHPGECPSSHMMHGCIEFLLNQVDPRAEALRSHFVFYIVPMINPDGVARGHTRMDTEGVNLNRTYRNPSKRRHPATYYIRGLLDSLSVVRGKLALFIDMHAHANKRGVFFYGNSMEAPDLLQSLLYTKLVSLNSPYFEFHSCNFSEANMFATGKTGEGRDNSSRVTLFQRTGMIHSYTVEASHVVGTTLNGVAPLTSCAIEEPEVQQGSACPRYTVSILGEVGKNLLVALLDLKGWNPLSRLPLTMYHNPRGLLMSLQRQLQLEVAERYFKLAFLSGGQAAVTRDNNSNDPLTTVMAALKPGDIPDALTIKEGRGFPPLTIRGTLSFLPYEQALQLLAHTLPTCPPRSFVCGMTRRSLVSAGTGTIGPVRSLSNTNGTVMVAGSGVNAVTAVGRRSLLWGNRGQTS
uniref:Cytosolic carboxypeptidase-like protein 5 n=1 Tax=Trypanosoma congolense (strain IL3000) TaxID=1068625 RepID=G0UL10_TRYCI|nr:putative zinc carboxypeptidase [Trypanosoma congolense IL3000]